MDYLEFNAPNVVFHPKVAKFIQEQVVTPKVKEFFFHRGKKFEEIIKIDEGKCVTDLNFKKIEISYLYENLLKNLKVKNQNGFVWNIFYTITFDQQLVSKTCEKTNLIYNELCIGKFPVIYFIYFDLQDFFDAIRTKMITM
jgi:hypothetical protein